MRSAVLTLIALAAVSCGTGQPAVESPGDNETPVGATDTASDLSVDTVMDGAAVPATCNDLHHTVLKVPPTRHAFSTEFGAPDSVGSTVEANRHMPGAVDSLFTVYYPGLVLDIRKPEGGRDMATHVAAKDNRYLAFPGIGIGTKAARIEQVLGEPAQRDHAHLTYHCSEHVEQPVTFRIRDGRVSAIEIAYYVD